MIKSCRLALYPLPFPSALHHYILSPFVSNQPPSTTSNQKWAEQHPQVRSLSLKAAYTRRSHSRHHPIIGLIPPDTTAKTTRSARKAVTEGRTKKGTITRAYSLVSVFLFIDYFFSCPSTTKGEEGSQSLQPVRKGPAPSLEASQPREECQGCDVCCTCS